jgi:hypothetical protein
MEWADSADSIGVKRVKKEESNGLGMLYRKTKAAAQIFNSSHQIVLLV